MSNHPKLPKSIVMLVNKGNYVIAIKTLAEEEDISLAAAKTRIDDYESAQHCQQTSADTNSSASISVQIKSLKPCQQLILMIIIVVLAALIIWLSLT